MLRLFVLLCCSLAINAQLIEEAHPAPEPYSFAYSSPNEDGSSSAREEIGDANGRITGFYTLLGADGQQRRVEYVADENGFRASVSTNEIGTESKNAADAEYLSSAPTAAELVAAYEASGAGKARLEAQAIRQAAIRTGAVGVIPQRAIAAARIAQTGLNAGGLVAVAPVGGSISKIETLRAQTAGGLVPLPAPIAPIAPIAPLAPLGGGYSRFQSIRTQAVGGLGGPGVQLVGVAPAAGFQRFQSLRTQTLGNLGGIRIGGVVPAPGLQTIQTAGLSDLYGLQGLHGLRGYGLQGYGLQGYGLQGLQGLQDLQGIQGLQGDGTNVVVLPGGAVKQSGNTVLRFVTGSGDLQPLRLGGLQPNLAAEKILVKEAVQEISRKS